MVIVKYDIKNNDYILECWGASTKHPDSRNSMNEDVRKGQFTLCEYVGKKYQVYQWLLHVASEKTFPFCAEELVNYANTHWINWR